MRKTGLILIFILCMAPGCKKNKEAPTSGTATINNTLIFDSGLQTYVGYGFNFSKADLVSIVAKPGPDIFVDVDGSNLLFQANNLKDSFFNAGEYPDAATAAAEFAKILTPSVTQWEGIGTPVRIHQIWIYRTNDDHFAKLRITATETGIIEGREYAECTFEWVYQPDDSNTFPGK